PSRAHAAYSGARADAAAPSPHRIHWRRRRQAGLSRASLALGGTGEAGIACGPRRIESSDTRQFQTWGRGKRLFGGPGRRVRAPRALMRADEIGDARCDLGAESRAVEHAVVPDGRLHVMRLLVG